MVAGFRLENPNMSYVNVSTGGNSTGNNSNIVLPVPDEEMNDLSSSRSSIRGNILRGNDSNLLPDLMNSMPELRPVVMGGPSMSYEQMQTAYDQQQYYDCEELRDFTASQTQLQVYGGPHQPQHLQPGAHHNNNFHHGSGTTGFNHSGNHSNLAFGTTNSTNGVTLSSASSSSFSNSSNNQPRLRVANLPRASTSFGSHQPNSNSYANPAFPRSYSPTESQPYIPTGHLNNNHNNAASGFDDEPRMTIIRTTSTLEFTSGGSPQAHSFNNESHLNGGPMHPNQASGMSFQQQSVFLGGSSPPQAHLNGHDVGGVPRRAQRQARQRATVNAASGPPRTGGDVNTVKVVKDLLKSQETLVKENEDLKRKLQLLVSTFNDEQKLNKVLKCLKEKREAAHSHTLSTS